MNSGTVLTGTDRFTTSTLAETMVRAIGTPVHQCAQPPSAFDFAGDELTLVHGKYKGSFVITTGCSSAAGYWPYAYSQRTSLSLVPTATVVVGSIGNEPLRQVNAISGSLVISGSPNSIGRAQGCARYDITLSVRGKAGAG